MSIKTIGILMPGDMGHGCGKFFLDNKLSVITALDGRSNRTKKLSESAGIVNVGSITNIVKYSETYCETYGETYGITRHDAITVAPYVSVKLLQLVHFDDSAADT